MKVLVIGGSGFIGPPLVRELQAAGHTVALFHRGNASVEGTDVTRILGDRNRLGESAAALRQFAPEVVVDLILSSAPQAEELMRVFRGVARRVVAASSMDVYRACGVLHGTEPGPPEPVPLTEDSPLRVQPAYPPEQLKVMQAIFNWVDDAYDKVAVELALMAAADLPATVLRLPVIYGPGDRLRRLFPLLRRMDDGREKILIAEELVSWRWSRGYVEDIASAFALAVADDRAAGRVYNVAEEQDFTEMEWARLVAEQAGWHGEFVAAPMAQLPPHLRVAGNFAQHWTASSHRIRTELGYRERVSRAEALRRTIAWERAHPPETVLQPLDYAAEDEALAA